MKYLLLINVDEKAEAAKSQEEMGKVFAAYGQYTEELQAAGHMLLDRPCLLVWREAWPGRHGCR